MNLFARSGDVSLAWSDTIFKKMIRAVSYRAILRIGGYTLQSQTSASRRSTLWKVLENRASFVESNVVCIFFVETARLASSDSNSSAQSSELPWCWQVKNINWPKTRARRTTKWNPILHCVATPTVTSLSAWLTGNCRNDWRTAATNRKLTTSTATSSTLHPSF